MVVTTIKFYVNLNNNFSNHYIYIYIYIYIYENNNSNYKLFMKIQFSLFFYS